MSDTPQGPGWWEASDGKWYPPDSTPGPNPGPGQPPSYGAPAPGQAPGYGAPGQAPGQQPGYGAPGQAPGYGAPGQQPGYGAPLPGQPPGYGAPGQQPGYGPPPAKSSKTAWIVLGVILGGLVLLCFGCVAIIGIGANEAGEAIDELFIDFSNAVPAAGPASCEVVGLNASDNYEVEVEVTNASGVSSHYRVEYELFGPDGSFLGDESTTVRNVGEGETKRDDSFGFILETDPWQDVSCTVSSNERVPVEP